MILSPNLCLNYHKVDMYMNDNYICIMYIATVYKCLKYIFIHLLDLPIRKHKVLVFEYASRQQGQVHSYLCGLLVSTNTFGLFYSATWQKYQFYKFIVKSFAQRYDDGMTTSSSEQGSKEEVTYVT